MKKFMACALSACMVAATLVGCDKGGTTTTTTPAPSTGDGDTTATAADPAPAPADGKKVIELWAFTDEVPKMVDAYKAAHPDFDWEVNTTIKGTGDGYQDALDQALINGQVDMFAAEAAFVLKYAQGDMSKYVGAYEDLGLDLSKLETAQIAPYTIEIGTRPSDGKLVGLGYQATGGAFIYRRSIAKDVFGSDDPATVKKEIGGGTGSWDTYWEAAEKLKAKGYGICSGDGDMWHAIENSSDKGWLDEDGKLYIDPKREEFMDISKKLKDNGYHNDSQDWQESWFADMNGTSEKGVLGFFGPAWLINYTIAPNCGGSAVGEGTFGDWGVTESPIGFFWGGTWVMASQAAIDNGKAEGVKALIDYITLDDSEDGLQYAWATGSFSGTGDCVASGTVMSKATCTPDILAGQNMFEVFVPANAAANGKNLTQYDEKINNLWREQVREYTAGNKSKEEAIEKFKQDVNEQLGIEVE